MNTPYDDDNFPDLEVLALRKKVQELEQKLNQAQAVLRENDLLDVKTNISDVEELCVRELRKYNELSQKSAGLCLEDNKNIDLLHKNLLLARGKFPAEDKKNKKKQEPTNIADLLSIVGGDNE